ncbi:MAG: hypothetical protein ACTSVY_09960 [Candidatus Helarchaeota archaeon]
MKNKKFFCLVFIISIFLGLISSFINVNSATSPPLFTGSSTGGLYNIYMTTNSYSDSFGPTNYSRSFSKNISVSELDNVSFFTSKLEVQVQELTENAQDKIITDNITTHDFPVDENQLDEKPVKYAQFLSMDNLTLINYVDIYYNQTCHGGFFAGLVYFLDFYYVDALNESRVNHADHTGAVFSNPSPQAGWLRINFGEYLDPGSYYAVITIKGDGIVKPTDYNNNSWQIHEYENSSDDKGASLFKNSTGWYNISNDFTADFLLKVNLVPYYEPDTLDVHIYINEKSFPVTFIRDPAVYSYSSLKPIIYANVFYFLNETPTEDLVVNVTLNKSIPKAVVQTRIRYIHLEDVIGNFTLTRDTINWSVDFKKVNSSINVDVAFAFPSDWSIDLVYDTSMQEITEYGIFYTYIYENETFDRPSTALTIQDGGDGATTFQYHVFFHSQNYLINPRIFTSSIFFPQMTQSHQYFSADSIKFEFDLKGSRIPEQGNISYTMRSPFGESIYIGNFYYSNGILSSNDIDTLGWPLGTYTLSVFWTDGKEVGYIEMSFILQASPLLFIILLVSTISLGSFISYRYIRKRMRQRNWQKKIEYLFIVNKSDGRPFYTYSFGGKIEDPTLISGMLTAVSSFVKEAIKSKSDQLSVLDQKDKKVIIVSGEYSNVVIISEINISIIRKKAEEFIVAFEKQYRKIISSWSGETKPFKGTERLILKYFPISLEDRLIRQVGIELAEIKERLQSVTNKSEAINILRRTSNLVHKYANLVRDNYDELYNEIMKMADEKINAN